MSSAVALQFFSLVEARLKRSDGSGSGGDGTHGDVGRSNGSGGSGSGSGSGNNDPGAAGGGGGGAGSHGAAPALPVFGRAVSEVGGGGADTAAVVTRWGVVHPVVIVSAESLEIFMVHPSIPDLTVSGALRFNGTSASCVLSISEKLRQRAIRAMLCYAADLNLSQDTCTVELDVRDGEMRVSVSLFAVSDVIATANSAAAAIEAAINLSLSVASDVYSMNQELLLIEAAATSRQAAAAAASAAAAVSDATGAAGGGAGAASQPEVHMLDGKRVVVQPSSPQNSPMPPSVPVLTSQPSVADSLDLTRLRVDSCASSLLMATLKVYGWSWDRTEREVADMFQ